MLPGKNYIYSNFLATLFESMNYYIFLDYIYISGSGASIAYPNFCKAILISPNTVGSSMVDGNFTSWDLASLAMAPRNAFPDLVLGKAGTATAFLNAAIGPIKCRTNAINSWVTVLSATISSSGNNKKRLNGTTCGRFY